MQSNLATCRIERRARWPVLKASAAALAGIAAMFGVACRDGTPPSASRATLPAPQHLAVEMDRARAVRELADPARPQWDWHGTWAVQETRLGWTSAIGAEIAVPIALSGAVEIGAGFALLCPPGADLDDVAVVCEMRLRSSARDEVLASTRTSVHDACHAWRDLHGTATLGRDEQAELVLVARTESAVALDARSLAAWSVPHVASSARSKPNVLVLSIDALRADHLGCYGYARPTSPNLDALAGRGVLFERAISTAPWTLPSYGTLFTGLEPEHHRAGVSTAREAAFGTNRDVRNGDYEALNSECATLAGLLAERGYSTAGFVSNPFLDPLTRIDRGFGAWTQYLNRAEAGVDLAESWIGAQGQTPWFLFLHLFDPHGPYAPPPPFDERFAGRAFTSVPNYPPTLEDLRAVEPGAATKKLLVDFYDGEIAYVDAQVARLLAFLDARGLTENTLIVLHSDHGEEFWEHGSCEHGLTLFEETLRVPLAFVMPGRLRPGLRVAQRTSTVDVFATILELVGANAPKGLDGRSLVPLLDGQPLTPRPCLSEATLYGPRELKASSSAAEKFITDGATGNLWFDLGTDALERADRAAAKSERVRDLRAVLLERARRTREAPGPSTPAEFDRDRRRDLEKLGYPGGAEPR
jgi:arylsulfatase A-like enzyme